MPNISYIDGEYCNYEESKVHINDRGYHFGDSVYEVIIFDKNTYYDFDAHIKRLFKSLKSLQINFNKSPISIKLIIKNLIRINRAEYGSIYLQVSRGIVERSHSYHDLNMRPILSITITKKLNNFDKEIKGVKAITLVDNRWARPDIKTTQLLPNVLAKTEANKKNAYEAIFVDNDGFITEGSSSNIWIYNYEKEIITREIDGKILSGITRKSILEFAKNKKIKVVERKFSKKELYKSKEVFLTSASSFVTPIVKIDENKINDGKVGNMSIELRNLYFKNFINK